MDREAWRGYSPWGCDWVTDTTSLPILPYTLHHLLWMKTRFCCGWSEVLVGQSCLTLCHSMDCSLPRAPLSWTFQSKNSGVGSHSLLQRIFTTLGFLNCRQILYHLSHAWLVVVYFTSLLPTISSITHYCVISTWHHPAKFVFKTKCFCYV